MSFPNINGFSRSNDIRGVVSFIYDVISGQYRPLKPSDFGSVNILPLSQGTYGLNVTGITFSNYTGVAPEISGTRVSISMEPHSQNTQPVYYAFSGTATTGNAWELRGDRTVEVSTNTEIFFASQSGIQKVMVHYRVF